MNAKLLLPVLLLSFLAGCERPAPQADATEERRKAEQVRDLDERIARLQEIEDRSVERKVAETQEERDRLLREKQLLEAERDQLTASRNAAKAQATRAEREASAAKALAQDVARQADNDRANAQIDFFYPALDPHGEWIEVDGLGYCWQPRAGEVRTWRPYTDGRWVFTDHGWTWNSNEPFGWAVYHYGRWTKLPRVGWLWVPGTEWGPGWVSWRRSDEYIGWAPLPPEAWSATGFNAAVDDYYDIGPGSYTFVAADNLGAQNYVTQVIAPEQNITIIEKTVNITNVTYKKVQNTTVVYNAGPDLERVNSGSKKVPQLKVERVTDIRESAKAGPATQKDGVLRMAAPRLSGETKTAAVPQRVKERIGSKASDRGWSGVADKASVEKIRTRAKQEARLAEDRDRKGGRAERPETLATPVQGEPTERPETPVAPVRSPATPRAKNSAPPSAPISTPPRATPAPREEVATPKATQAPAVPVPTPALEEAPVRPNQRGEERTRRREARSTAAKPVPAPPAPAAPSPIAPSAPEADPAEPKEKPVPQATPGEPAEAVPAEEPSPALPEAAQGEPVVPTTTATEPKRKAANRENADAESATPRPGKKRPDQTKPASTPVR